MYLRKEGDDLIYLLYYESAKIWNKKAVILSILILLATFLFVFINSTSEYDCFYDGRGKVQMSSYILIQLDDNLYFLILV